MVDDIPMGNALFINTPFSFSSIEKIGTNKLSKWLNLKKTTTNKAELKKTCGANGWISIHIIKIKISTNYNASPSGRISNYYFYIQQRTKKKTFPKLFTYHEIPKKSAMVPPGSTEILNKFHPFIGTGPIFLNQQ